MFERSHISVWDIWLYGHLLYKLCPVKLAVGMTQPEFGYGENALSLESISFMTPWDLLNATMCCIFCGITGPK